MSYYVKLKFFLIVIMHVQITQYYYRYIILNMLIIRNMNQLNI